MSQHYSLVPTNEHNVDNDASRVSIHDIDSDDDDENDITIPTHTRATLPTTSTSSPHSTSSSQHPPQPSTLHITLICQGEANRIMSCSADWSIQQLKAHAYPTEVSANKLIRVIYLGRVLLDEQRLCDTGIEDGHCLHVLVTDKLTVTAAAATNAATSHSAYQLTSSASHTAPPSPTSPYHHYPQYINTASGQVIPIDQLYHTHLTAPIPPHPDDGTDPSTLAPSASEPSTGSSRDFAIGYMLGFLLGFLACLLLWSTHSTVKQRLGILCGMMTNIMLGSYVQKEQRQQTGGGVGGSGGFGGRGMGGSGSSDGGGGGLGAEVDGLP